MHLVVALEGTLRARAAGGSGWHDAPGVLTGPNVPHAIDARGRVVLLVFFDPEGDAGGAMRGALQGRPLRPLTSAERGAIAPATVDPVRTMREGGVAWSRELAGILGGGSLPVRRIHPRVRKLLRHIQSLPAGADTSLETLAGTVSLSPGRLMHAFTESIGLPLRAYLLWCKLQRAAAGVTSGVPLAQAAVLAGFSDAAHMARAFRRMFGVAPSMLKPQPRAP
jgi:AraC-like DNA-binding protein